MLGCAQEHGLRGGQYAAGGIKYARGKITIVDRPAIEECSCECYSVIRRETEKTMGPG
jgi:hypothetical protein